MKKINKIYKYPESIDRKLKKYNLNKDEVLKLEYNEPDFPASEKTITAVKRFIQKNNLNWYPDGRCRKLKKAIAAYTKNDFLEIAVGNGSDEILFLIAAAFVKQKDKVVIPAPNYEMFEIDSRFLGADIKKVFCEDDLSFDYEKLKNDIDDDTCAVYISNPNSPIGNYFSKKQITSLLKKYPDTIFVIDEAYFEYSDITVSDKVKDFRNLIVVRTFSKAFSIASLRLGYSISCKNNIKRIEKAKSLIPESVNQIAQIAGKAALKDIEYMKKNTESVKRSRDYLTKKLRKVGLKIFSSKGNFFLVKFSTNDKALYVKESLEKQGVFVRDRTYKPKLAGCLRIGVPLFEKADNLFEKIKRTLK
ncbi:aminotransferase class I/II-fold pyridoxal phosphate-dependent enzyme [Candidatus Woesearchaeota archaeon]|nr:aminotransferase class I/II-fold pyridoxal phosphate-dependent enzyme [Candidatus Woesearchaeota archaeon]